MKPVGVVGAGTMGSGIAYVVALHRHAPILLVDISPKALEAARKRIQAYAQNTLARGRVPEAQVRTALERLHYTLSIQECAEAELVFEAVNEELALKQQVFQQLEKIVARDTVLASNTSSFSIGRLVQGLAYPERVVGAHFFNPVPAMKLVELVRTPRTSPETLAQAEEFCRSLRKEVVVVNDGPGFVTTRVGQALIVEAINCLESGLASAEAIDKSLRLAYNYLLGPLELADLIGLDVELAILEELQRELGERFAPPPLLRQLVAQNHLGRKSGCGFHAYPPAPIG